MANVAKSKNSTCQPGAISTGMSEEDFSWRSKGEGVAYPERLWHLIQCQGYGVELMTGYMADHSRQLHEMEPEIDRD